MAVFHKPQNGHFIETEMHSRRRYQSIIIIINSCITTSKDFKKAITICRQATTTNIFRDYFCRNMNSQSLKQAG